MVLYNPGSGSFSIDVNEAAVDVAVTQIQPTLTPSVNISNNIDWVCTQGLTATNEVRYLPATCRGT
jgi:hypothetical protein